jgi:peptidoglycan/xylan/chitin deacetylase (PgdA/CDA1 family)
VENKAVINICFHGIGSPQRSLGWDEDRYWISTDLYSQVLMEVAERRDVAISFDDGNISDIEFGLEGLLRHELTATFFVLAGRLGHGGSLAARDLEDLQRHGMRIGNHGMDHVPWRFLTPAQQHRELIEARQEISYAAGVPVMEAALPHGSYDRRILSNLRLLGYQRVFSSDRRRANREAWLQPRFSIHADDTIESIRSRILAPASRIHELKTRSVGVIKRLR